MRLPVRSARAINGKHPAAAGGRPCLADLEMLTYTISHDLKGPLFTITALGECLLEDVSPTIDERSQEYLRRLVDAGRHRGKLIDDLLDMSRAARPATAERVGLHHSVLIVTENELHTSIERRGAIVTVQPDLPDVAADTMRVQQIYRNLIDNAIKFNASKRPAIVVGCEGIIDGFAWLFVKDNGIGMAEAEHERAFGLFERLHPDDGYSGTGAGLSIVKRAVEAFDGRIWIEGAAGRGSTFPFTLPAWAGAITDEGAQQIRQRACEDAVETTHHSSRRGQP